jgi:hypothetical protein
MVLATAFQIDNPASKYANSRRSITVVSASIG